jgi:hypothetical protein
MIYHYVGIYGDQSAQMSLGIKHVVKNHLGGAELIIEESADLLLLENLHSRVLASDSILVSSVFQFGETALEILNRVTVFTQQNVKIISVAEGVVDAGLSEFFSAVLSEVNQGNPVVTMESSKGRGKRMLLHG